MRDRPIEEKSLTFDNPKDFEKAIALPLKQKKRGGEMFALIKSTAEPCNIGAITS